MSQHLSPDVWVALEAPFVGADIEDNWRALFRTTELFRAIATEIVRRLELKYFYDLDEGILR